MLLRGFGTREHDYLFKSKREYVLISFEGTGDVSTISTGAWRNVLGNKHSDFLLNLGTWELGRNNKHFKGSREYLLLRIFYTLFIIIWLVE